MNFLNALCLYKKHWFLSWIIVMIILSTIYNIIELDMNIQNGISGVYFIIHLIIVVFINNHECAKLKIIQEKEQAELILNKK